MKLTIERASLLRSLGHVQSVVERRNTIPILSNVLLETREGQLSLTATDLDLAIVENVDAAIETPGTITTSAHTLYDIVRKLPDGSQVDIHFSGEDSRLIVSAGRSRFQLACLPKDDFPMMTAGDLPHRFQLPAKDLKRLIDKTRFAVSTEETRYYLNGIYLHVTESGGAQVLRAVATDGHRLARVELPLPQGSAGMPGVIVPRKTIGEVRKLIDEFDGAVGISLSDTKIRFAFNDAVVTSKLIDGTFPDYNRVIPEGNDKHLEVDGPAFAEAVDRVSTISTEKSRAVKLGLEGGRMTLSANSPDSGSATEELSIEYSGNTLEIGFNSRYLLDILAQVEGETARVEFNDAASPTIVQDPGDNSALYVLMPMRV